MKIAVIGAGMSGLAIANLLKERHEVVVFEKQAQAGGLIKCEVINSVLFHKVGGHVFNAKNKIVLEWFWSHFDREKEFHAVKRNAKIFIRNKVIGYPIENYLYHLDPETVNKIIGDLLESNSADLKNPLEHPNFEEFLISNFGDTLYKLYFKPYNSKIWNVDMSTIPLPWLDGKLPMPDLKAILLSNIVREEESQMVHSTFYYPKANGSQFLVDRLSQSLDIRVNQNVSHIQKNKGKYVIENETDFDAIVYCGDVRQMPDYMNDIISKKTNISDVKKLRSNGTSNMLCTTDSNDISWLYIPEDSMRAHRIIYTGNFSNNNNGNSTGKTCVVEFSGKVSYTEMVSEISKLPGNLKPISYNYEPNSYIVHGMETKSVIQDVRAALEGENIHLLGRFAEWEYYNMDKCIEAAMSLSEKYF